MVEAGRQCVAVRLRPGSPVSPQCRGAHLLIKAALQKVINLLLLLGLQLLYKKEQLLPLGWTQDCWFCRGTVG